MAQTVSKYGDHAHAAQESVLELNICNAYNATEYADLEACFNHLPGVKSVHIDGTRYAALQQHFQFPCSKTAYFEEGHVW